MSPTPTLIGTAERAGRQYARKYHLDPDSTLSEALWIALEVADRIPSSAADAEAQSVALFRATCARRLVRDVADATCVYGATRNALRQRERLGSTCTDGTAKRVPLYDVLEASETNFGIDAVDLMDEVESDTCLAAILALRLQGYTWEEVSGQLSLSHTELAAKRKALECRFIAVTRY